MGTWTSEKEGQLRELCGQGLTVAEVAKRLGLPFHTVAWRIRRLGLSTRPAIERPLEKVRQIEEDSRRYGIGQTARIHGVSPDVVENCRRRFAARVQREIVHGDVLPDLWARALAVGVSQGLGQDAPDFAQWAILQRLRGLKIGDLRTRLIDFKREEYGNTNGETGRARASERRHGIPLVEGVDPGVAGYQPETEAEPELSRSRREVLRILHAVPLEASERLILFMQFVYGTSQAEIGAVLGVTESRVSQITSAALGRLKLAAQSLPSLLERD